MSQITPAQAQQHLPDWTVVDGRLELSVRAKNFVQAIEFVNRFAEVAEEQDHHPDFEIRYNTIRMRVVSHDVGGLSNRDLKFAAAVDELIEEFELKRQPEKITRTQLVLVTPNIGRIKPFWKAVFDFKDGDDDQLVDRSDVLPPVRFQQFPEATVPADDARPTGGLGSAHLDVFVPAQLAKARLQAAIEAGGKLLNDANAPRAWELSDMDGNRVFLRTDG